MPGVVRSFLETEIRRRIVVPEAARAFLAIILGLDQRRPVAAFGAISAEHRGGSGQLVGPRILADHDAKEFGNRVDGGIGRDVIVAARAHRAASVGIPLLAQGQHLLHVFHRDHRVASLPKQNAGTVAEVNHGVAHHFQTLLPLPAFHVPFLVASGADLDDAVAVGRIGIDALRRDVHPADVVGVAIADQLGLVVVHPVRIGLPQAGPLVAGTLGEAFQVDELAVEIHAAGSGAALEFGLAETSDHFVDVHRFAVYREDGVHVVEIRVFRTPETCALERRGGRQDGLFAIDHVDRTACEPGANLPVAIDNHGRQLYRGAIAGGIAHLRIDRNGCALSGNIEVGGMHVDPGAFQAVVKRQGLINFAGDVQPDMPVDAAVVGIEVVGVPFKRGAAGTLLVIGAIIHLDCQHVLFAPEMNRAGDVQSEGSHPVFVKPGWFAVQKNVAGLSHTFKFEEDLVAGKFGRKFEMLAVPDETLEGAAVPAAVGNDLTE